MTAPDPSLDDLAALLRASEAAMGDEGIGVDDPHDLFRWAWDRIGDECRSHEHGHRTDEEHPPCWSCWPRRRFAAGALDAALAAGGPVCECGHPLRLHAPTSEAGYGCRHMPARKSLLEPPPAMCPCMATAEDLLAAEAAETVGRLAPPAWSEASDGEGGWS